MVSNKLASLLVFIICNLLVTGVPSWSKINYNISKRLDIGGLEDIIEELRESVLYPLTV